jgi:hypothetical protein
MDKGILCILLMIVTILVVLVAEEYMEDKQELDLYCEMVSIRKRTNDPTLGWPDYKGIYDEECK